LESIHHSKPENVCANSQIQQILTSQIDKFLPESANVNFIKELIITNHSCESVTFTPDLFLSKTAAAKQSLRQKLVHFGADAF